jgi:hypothetical protein
MNREQHYEEMVSSVSPGTNYKVYLPHNPKTGETVTILSNVSLQHRTTSMKQVKATFYLGANTGDKETVTDNFFGMWLRKLSRDFPNFTVTLGQGLYWGISEKVRVVSVINGDSDMFRDSTRILAREYKAMFDQDSVGLEYSNVDWELV